MPKGAIEFLKSAERAKSRQTSDSNTNYDLFQLQGGQRARVRFLEQGNDLAWAYYHRIKTAGSRWPREIPCLDQEDEGVPCPACQSEDRDIRRRSHKGLVNLIWRGNEDVQELNQRLQAAGQMPFALAPNYKRSDAGYPEKNTAGEKIILGFADGLFLWRCSKSVFLELLQKDSTYKGLMSRDFQIARQGKTKDDTKYFIEPAEVDGGPQPMLQIDQEVYARKHDLDVMITPPAFEDMATIVANAVTGGNDVPFVQMQSAAQVPAGPQQMLQDVFGGQPVRSSAFSR